MRIVNIYILISQYMYSYIVNIYIFSKHKNEKLSLNPSRILIHLIKNELIYSCFIFLN